MRFQLLLRGLGRYLSDWKNLLAHGLVGVALVTIPLVLPLPPAGRILVFVLIVALNLLRMKIEKRMAAKKAAALEAETADA